MGGVILIFLYYKCYITVFDKVLSIHLFVFILFKYLLIYLLQKVPYFLCKLCLFYVYFIFLTTLKYHSNKF